VDEITTEGAAEDLRGIARERPAWFFGGAFVLGLALGRFARATAGNLAESNTASATPVRRRSTGASKGRREQARPAASAAQRKEPSTPTTGVTRTGALRP
jgi:hypothetical protein